MAKGLTFSSTTPAAPSGFQNVTFRTDLSDPTQPKISAFTPSIDLNGSTFQPIPGISNGWSVCSVLALTNSLVVIKSSAGNFGGYMLYNPNAVPVYIQLFDTASPVLGTSTPLYVIPLPAGAAANVEWSLGISHDTSIQAAVTTTPTGNTAPVSNLIGFFLYE